MSPPGPSEPGGFDFRRYAWFRGLGAVGYTREGVQITSGPSSGIFTRLFDKRMALSARIKAGVSQVASGPAAAIITGDRSSLTRAQLQDLRRSNLAHLLAISGLHVALLTGVVFGFFRRLCLLNTNAFLHFNAKKIAAGLAILIGLYYLLISGAAVSTQRAFIMVSIVMLGVFFDRRALSLHSIALAALVILAWRPEDVSSAGFQMSFAATIALVTVFQRIPALPRFSRLRQMPVISLILSSLVAGLATAPFSAAHFNQVSHYGLLANILSLPVMGFLVAPSAVLAMMLMPFGAEAVGLWGVDLGLRWILTVAHFFAQPASAVTFVTEPDAWILPLFSASCAWIILWRGWGKGGWSFRRCRGFNGLAWKRSARYFDRRRWRACRPSFAGGTGTFQAKWWNLFDPYMGAKRWTADAARKSLCIVERSKRRPLSPLVEKNERIRNYVRPRRNTYFGAATPHKRGMLASVSS